MQRIYMIKFVAVQLRVGRLNSEKFMERFLRIIKKYMESLGFSLCCHKLLWLYGLPLTINIEQLLLPSIEKQSVQNLG